MLRSDKSLEWYVFFVLLLLNIWLRFSGLGDFSLSNDELSAVVRLEADGFSDLIQKGVIATDPHPAGAQVFMYYWSYLFGISEWALRIPFASFGLLALLFLYSTFKRWFGFQRAALAIAFISFLEFFIIHGQMARPYALGFFATSLFVWSWDKYLLNGNKSILIRITYVMSAALACYTHYFAGLFAGIVALSGLIFSFKKGEMMQYLLTNVLVLILFIPHINITIAQLSRDELVDWIPLPKADFISDHIFILLNQSKILLLVFILFLAWSIQQNITKNRGSFKFLTFSLFFFFVPILIGYIYTLLAGPALMDRVLYFSAPFFIVLAFSAIPVLNNKAFLLLFNLLSIVVIASTSLETSFASHDYTENFREIGAVHDKIVEEYGENNVLVTGNYNSPFYLNYYTKNQVNFSIDKFQDDKDLALFMKGVRSSDVQHLFHSWACVYQSIESVEYVRSHYPTILEQGHFYNSGYWLFDKKQDARDSLLVFKYESDSSSEESFIDMKSEYVNFLVKDISEIKRAEVVTAMCTFGSQNLDDVVLVIQIKNANGENLRWKGKNLTDFVLDSEYNEIIICDLLPDHLKDTDEINVYLWNPRLLDIGLKSVEVSIFEDTYYPDLY